MMKPCIDCGTPSHATRCPLHTGRHTRKVNRTAQIKRGQSPYDQGDYRTRAKHVRATATICHICGQGPRPDDPWQADHVIPVSKGGEVGPLAAAHRSCNISRANKLRAGQPDIATPQTRRGRGTPHQPDQTNSDPAGNPTGPSHNSTRQPTTNTDTPNNDPDKTQMPAGDTPYPPNILYP
jgi:hypothetical protein